MEPLASRTAITALLPRHLAVEERAALVSTVLGQVGTSAIRSALLEHGGALAVDGQSSAVGEDAWWRSSVLVAWSGDSHNTRTALAVRELVPLGLAAGVVQRVLDALVLRKPLLPVAGPTQRLDAAVREPHTAEMAGQWPQQHTSTLGLHLAQLGHQQLARFHSLVLAATSVHSLHELGARLAGHCRPGLGLHDLQPTALANGQAEASSLVPGTLCCSLVWLHATQWVDLLKRPAVSATHTTHTQLLLTGATNEMLCMPVTS